MPIQNRERPQKILVAMGLLSAGTTKQLKYEDIVVKAFELFPDDFALRGYPKYPDSSDVHKPLYGILKRQGLVRSADKTFALTERGVKQAAELKASAGERLTMPRDARRMSRDVAVEIERMKTSAAFSFFLKNEPTRILDTDFFNFVGGSARMGRNEFIGRLTASEEAIKTALELKQPSLAEAEALSKLWDLLTKKFAVEINQMRQRI